MGETGTGGLERELVADRAHAENATDRNIGKIRVMAKSFTREDVAQVHFDEGNIDRKQGVAQGDAGMRECSRIEDYEGNGVAFRRLNPGYQFVLRVALRGNQLVTQRLRKRGQADLDVLQRCGAVHTRLASAEQIEIRSIEQQNSRQCETPRLWRAKVRDNNQNLG